MQILALTVPKKRSKTKLCIRDYIIVFNAIHKSFILNERKKVSLNSSLNSGMYSLLTSQTCLIPPLFLTVKAENIRI
jgi:hypothetical protein